MPEPADVAAAVRSMIEASGLPLTDEEFEGFLAAYPIIRAAADRLYRDEFRYEEPAPTFRPVPPAGRED